MRGLLALAALLLLAAPTASAQMVAPLSGNLDAPIDPVGAEGAKVTLTLRLHCPNQVHMMPETVVDLQVRGRPDTRHEGPESVTFPAFQCLQQGSIDALAEYQVRLPANATPDTVFTFEVHAEPQWTQMSQLTGQASPWEGSFQLTSPPAPPTPDLACLAEEDVAALETQAEEVLGEDPATASVPGLGWLAPLLGLVGVALLRRRAV